MAQKKSEKHPKDMTNQELAEHVFHPHILKHAKKEIDLIDNPPQRPSRKKSTK
jgi:hypothetical protein